jgi:hypothetical protein
MNSWDELHASCSAPQGQLLERYADKTNHKIGSKQTQSDLKKMKKYNQAKGPSSAKSHHGNTAANTNIQPHMLSGSEDEQRLTAQTTPVKRKKSPVSHHGTLHGLDENHLKHKKKYRKKGLA